MKLWELITIIKKGIFAKKNFVRVASFVGLPVLPVYQVIIQRRITFSIFEVGPSNFTIFFLEVLSRNDGDQKIDFLPYNFFY